MGLNVTSIDELDPDLVAQTQDEFAQLVQEKYPEILLIRGVYHDLVSYFAGGVCGGLNQTEINRVLRSNSLKAIEEDPTLAEDDIVDRVMSNYRIMREEGTNAIGEITIVVSEDEPVIIHSGSIFTTNGIEYRSDDAYTARQTDSEILNPTDRILEPQGDGTYSFSIDATAVEEGSAGNLNRGTIMVPSTPINNYVTSYAGTDFALGTNTETNAELLEKLQLGIAARVMQGRLNIKGLIKEQEQFARTLDYSIIGYGNPEMERDQHWIWPMSGGGRLDIYSRTAPLPNSISMLKTATLVDVTGEGGVWQFSIERDDAPGFYEVEQVILPSDAPDTGTFEITADIRGLDIRPEEFSPDLINTVEGAYTKYQTAVIRFIDTVTDPANLTIGDTQEYRVGILAMPLIKEIQDFCLQADTRNLASDIAVKAAVPCFLTINFDIRKAAETVDPDVTSIKEALVDRINHLGFPGQLHASLIAEVTHDYLETRQNLSRIDMHGRIRRPNGTIEIIRATDILQIPDDPGNLVTGNTTEFIIDVDNIGISIVIEGYAVEV